MPIELGFVYEPTITGLIFIFWGLFALRKVKRLFTGSDADPVEGRVVALIGLTLFTVGILVITLRP